jgi:hypothetical protein
MRAANLPPRSGPAAAASSSTTGLGTRRRRPPGVATPSLPDTRSLGWDRGPGAAPRLGRGGLASTGSESTIQVSSGVQGDVAPWARLNAASLATVLRHTSDAEGPSSGSRPRARAPRRATPPHFMLGDICRAAPLEVSKRRGPAPRESGPGPDSGGTGRAGRLIPPGPVGRPGYLPGVASALESCSGLLALARSNRAGPGRGVGRP